MNYNYEKALAAVLKHEGGYVNHPKDPGGATMKGVTQAVYDAYRSRKGLIKQSVAKISDFELQTIYRHQYWDEVKGDLLPSGVDYCVFDFAVNSGPKRAAQFLQRAIGVDDDGHIGMVTLDKVDRADEVGTINAICNARMGFLKGLPTWTTFGKGWTSRVAGVRALAVKMAAQKPVQAPATPSAPSQPAIPAIPASPPEPAPVAPATGFWAWLLSLFSKTAA